MTKEKVPVDPDNTSHYINNKEFLKCLIEYQADIKKCKKEGKDKPYVSDYIAMCFLQIAQRLSYRPNFINYTYKDDMISDGLENCLAYMHNFNPEKSTNPFAYFTQIIYYAFLRRIQKEKKQQYIKYKVFTDQKTEIEEEHEKLSNDFVNEKGSADFHIHIKEFIDEMERKEKEKKHKRELKKAEREGKTKKNQESKTNLDLFML
jgi:DNA-directed RNA polymerase specialized sigma24 family protein|tara:strand:+ start:6610 stop:7224 length:615 start_codon:yes stop_codon:yes gene_type:complete